MFYPLYIIWITTALRELFVAAILRFPKGSHSLNETDTFRDYTIILFVPRSLRHYWSRNQWRNRGFNETKKFFTVCEHEIILKGFRQWSFFQVLLLSSVYSSQREYFLLSFTIMIHTIFIQGFNYLITYPRGNCFHLRNTAFQLFQLFEIFCFFSNDNRNIYFISKSFPLYLANPIRAFIIRWASKKIFFGRSTKFVFTERCKLFFKIFSFSFPSDSTRGCRAKVWYRTRNTPARLGFAPWRFSTMWALVSMFLSFSTRVMLHHFSISSLYFDTLSMVTWKIFNYKSISHQSAAFRFG